MKTNYKLAPAVLAGVSIDTKRTDQPIELEMDEAKRNYAPDSGIGSG